MEQQSKRSILTLALLLGGMFFLVGCEGGEGTQQLPFTPTPTPTATPTPVPTVTAINLSAFAKADAISQYFSFTHKDYKAKFAADTISGQNVGHSWASDGDGNHAWITLYFDGVVKLDHLSLFDNPKAEYNLLSGFITFFNAEDHTTPETVDFTALPTNGMSPLPITDVKGYKVTELTVHIDGYEDTSGSPCHGSGAPSSLCSGLSEIGVFGTPVAMEHDRKNIAPYSFARSLSQVKNYVADSHFPDPLWVQTEDLGNYGPFNMTDGTITTDDCTQIAGKLGDFYKGAGTGSNTRVKFEFVANKEIDRLVVIDLPVQMNGGNHDENAHVKQFKVLFEDGASEVLDMDPSGCTVVDLTSTAVVVNNTSGQPITTDFIQLEVKDHQTGWNGNSQVDDDAGFAEVLIMGASDE